MIATQGHGDEDVIESALAGTPAYLGVVASSQRSEALRGYLADRNISQYLLDSIRMPVGLDLGKTTHREVAVAVLAELVKMRPLLKSARDRELLIERTAEAVDPVCGMTVNADRSGHPLKVDGETYYFCCLGCRSQYENEAVTTDFAGGATC